MNPHTVSSMYFEGTEATHATPHLHPIGTSAFVHPLNDLIVKVGVVEIILVDRQPPRMGQATHHRHPRDSIHGATLNLGKRARNAEM